jgi:hypothetical protein
VWGEEDSALCVESTDRTAPLVADFTLRRLPGVSHWVQQEAPEKVNVMVSAWLKGEPVPLASETGDLPRLPEPSVDVTSSGGR